MTDPVSPGVARYRALMALWMQAREEAGGTLTQSEEAAWASYRMSTSGALPAHLTREYGRASPFDPTPRVRIKIPSRAVLRAWRAGHPPV